MFEVRQITSDSKQSRRLVLPDGTFIDFTMTFVPMQFGWFITTMTYNGFTINGLRIVVSPNMLYQYKNKLPFGLSCFSKESREPSLLQDFSSGNAKLYVLTQSEVQQYSDVLSGKV